MMWGWQVSTTGLGRVGTDKYQQLVPAVRKIRGKEETKKAKWLSQLAIKVVKVTQKWFDPLVTETYLKSKTSNPVLHLLACGSL